MLRQSAGVNVPRMESVYERHARISQITRDGIKDLGLDLLVSDEAYASNTVTAIKVPEGVDGGRLRSLVREEHNVVLAGGQPSRRCRRPVVCSVRLHGAGERPCVGVLAVAGP